MEVVLDYEAAAHDEDVDKEPDHFCTISSAEAAKKHPCITVELSAGQVETKKEKRERERRKIIAFFLIPFVDAFLACWILSSSRFCG